MRNIVNVIFSPSRSIEIVVDGTSQSNSAQAIDWIENLWGELGCEPLRASGKVLLLDKIIGVADAIGYKQLQSNQDKANEFASYVAQALEKPTVNIDLIEQTITY